jgi:hypothetical protein
MKSQRGGIILPYKDAAKQRETFIKYLINSDISILAKGSYGLTLESQLIISPPEDSVWIQKKDEITGKSYYENRTTRRGQYKIPADLMNVLSALPHSLRDNHYKKMVPSSEYGNPVHNLVIKLCIIRGESSGKFTGYKDENLVLDYVTENDFQNEINIQTDVFLKTLQYLKPLTPGIVYADIIKRPEWKEYFLNLIHRAFEKNGKPKIKNLADTFTSELMSKCYLGIIAMELVSPAKTLSHTIEDLQKVSPQSLNKIKMVKNIGRYGLLQLALQTGYSQNDFHGSNIMMMNDSEYFSDNSLHPFRPIIIDFGRAVKIPPNIMEIIRNLVKEKKYIGALQYLCDKSFSHERISNIKYANTHYGWICGDYNMNGRDYIEDFVKKYPKYDVDTTKSFIPKPESLTLGDHLILTTLFNGREACIDKTISLMNNLHARDPEKYPLLPVSNQIKNSLYNGMIGGKNKKHKRPRKLNKTKKSNKTTKNRNLKKSRKNLEK